MPYLVTVAVGASNVALPSGQIVQGGQAALLTDEQFIRLSPTALTSTFSAIAAVVTTSGNAPATTVGPQVPIVNGSVINGVWTVNNPYTESDNEPSSSTTPLNTPYVNQGP